MLTPGMRLKNAAFLLLGAVVLGHLALNYADLGRFAGIRDHYVVHAELAETGGLYTHAVVTYRGVPVGKVGAVELTGDGVRARLHIQKSAADIPADLDARVAARSAIGEQYIDLVPRGDTGPYLAHDAVIPRDRTATPEPVTTMLTSLNRLTSSVPLDSLATVVDELGTAFEGQDRNLQRLLDAGGDLLEAADAALPATTSLIVDSEQVLRTQAEESDAIREFATGARQLAARLAASDTDLRRLISTTPLAATQLSGALSDLDPRLSVLLANLTTTAEVAVTRQHGVEELMVRVPEAVGAVSSAVSPDGVNFGMALTFFEPAPCTVGYEGTVYRNGLDTSPGPGLNTEAHCAADPATGSNVRGSANAPGGGRLPEPAVPGAASSLGAAPSGGLPGALGLPAVAEGSAATTGGQPMARLLGLGGDA